MARGARAGIVGLLAGVFGLGLTPTATSAQEPPPPRPVFPGGDDETPRPGYEEYAGCPLLDTGSIRLCINATVSGSIRIGKVTGAIDDLQLKMAVGADSSGGNAAIVPALGGGQPSSVVVPGGLLGIPGLQPLLDLDVLQLLSLSATPTLGELQQTGLDAMLGTGLIGFSFGYPTAGTPILAGDAPAPLPPANGELCIAGAGCLPWPQVDLGMPLTLQLNNLLLGTDCRIGPIDVAVSTAEPGGSGALTYNDLPVAGGQFHIDGIHLVGSNFAAPGSDCAGLLGTGDLIDSVLGVNPFDAVINAVAGLPSPAGRNAADLTVDLHVATQEAAYGSPFALSTTSIDFGAVAVNTTADRPVTVTNVRTSPRTFVVQSPSSSSRYTIVDNGCLDTPVDGGGSCTFTIRFSPINTSTRTGTARVTSPPEIANNVPANRVALTGVGSL